MLIETQKTLSRLVKAHKFAEFEIDSFHPWSEEEFLLRKHNVTVIGKVCSNGFVEWECHSFDGDVNGTGLMSLERYLRIIHGLDPEGEIDTAKYRSARIEPISLWRAFVKNPCYVYDIAVHISFSGVEVNPEEVNDAVLAKENDIRSNTTNRETRKLAAFYWPFDRIGALSFGHKS